MAFCTVLHAQDDRHEWNVQVDVTSAAPTTRYGAGSGSIGKLRYDEDYRGIGLGRVLVEYKGRIAPTLRVNVVGDYVEDDSGGVDLTEAFLEWRPVPRSAYRHRVKFGAFYPELSLENSEPGWANAFSISQSAINTWIGEELRTVGAEWSLQKPLGAPGSGRQIKWIGATYYGNDPAGALLAWKGWGLHDRQTRLNDRLPLPSLPQIAPDGRFWRQAPQAEPFLETDHRPGYYFGARWRALGRLLVSAMHYDNHADPRSLRDGQYGWTTRFNHVGAQIELPHEMGLVAQWMRGTTAMGPIVNGARAVDNAFASNYVLLTKRMGAHRLSARYDDFEVVDRDTMPLDDNGESGRAWTAAYRYEHSERWALHMEWLRVTSTRPSWAYFGLPVRGTEDLLQMRLAVRL
jgi:hypothetical protein